MHPGRLLALFTAVLLSPALAAAQPGGRGPYGEPPGPPDQGFVLSGRIGYGFPGGDLAGPSEFQGSTRVSDTADGKVPFWLELGYRFTGHVWGTAYLELAPASVASTFCGGGDCTGSDVRAGLELQYHFLPYQQVDPWLGLGVGAEFLNDHDNVSGTSERFSGWEFPMLEGGLDFAVTRRFALGPYASLSYGQYTSHRVEQAGVATTTDIADQAWHNWFQVGVKATIKL